MFTIAKYDGDHGGDNSTGTCILVEPGVAFPTSVIFGH